MINEIREVHLLEQKRGFLRGELAN
jgi:hypothetical protein